MKTYTLSTASYMNPYYIYNKRVNAICFYDETGVLYTHHSGWFGNNRLSIRELESIAFKRKLKETFNTKDNYFIAYKGRYDSEHGYKLYIHKDSMKVTFLGNQVAYKTMTETSYADFVEITAVFNDKLETRRFHSVCSHVVKTDYGTKIAAIDSYLKEKNISLSRSAIEELIKDKKTLIYLLKQF